MSSAAMQTAPAHTSAAPTTSYTTSHPQNAYPSRASATHHQQHSRSSQSVDRSARGSPPSRRSNPQPTTNGVNPSSTLAPQQGPYESASPTMNVSVQQSPNLANSQSPVSADHSQSRSNVPEGLAIPPRTSSHQRPRNHASGHSRSRGDETSEGRSRRRAQQSSETPSNTNDSRSQRHQKSTDNTGTVSSTEVDALSPVLNHVEITDPAEDIEREHERQLEAQNSPAVGSSSTPVLGASGEEGADENNRGAMKSRHDYSNQSSRRKETTFGKYILGQTLGEGEFGKVKLGWRRDGGVQVAIKLIRRESLGANPSRLPKIYREISILRDLSHPNIVRLHEMVETDRYIGIIMEYASGGELFDFILNNRYLKDHAARRLFAQLISGVGYLHKKGIVHRDLKLENLLLDKNRNIIITDFGFANTFNLGDELSDEIEYNLTNREFVKRMRLDKLDANGLRRGDLMQTSCGSPCYAAPELVVSDSLYTGRKVDVWSCGVILYAMLAGYLPFDDDPANPEGDNINLLYKYIVSTPLTFPEYVTPHARDLLRRILVPDPRKRADLFEVARHSWLSEFSHVVSHITSSTTNISDIATTTVPAEGTQEGPSLARSASVREPQKSFQTSASTLGGLTHQQGKVAQDESAEKTKTSREQKRRTVQVEYVAPQSQTTRGESSSRSAANSAADVSTSTPRAAVPAGPRAPPDQNKPLPSEPRGAASRTDYSSSSQDNRPDAPRSTSETTGAMYNTRPNTGHSMASLNAGRLPSRGSYGQPVAPTVAATNAQGRLAQPKNGKQYNISAPIPQDADISIGRPSTHQLPAKYSPNPPADIPRGHKRSSTVSSIGEKIFGRSGSLFGNRSSQGPSRPKPSKRYPPTSMKEPYAGDDSRASIDSRQSNSHMSRSEGRPRRFSLINSLKGLSSSGRSEQHSETDSQEHNFSRPATGPSGPIGRENTYEAYVSTRGSERPTETDYSSHIDRQFAELQEYQADAHAGGPNEHANNDFYGYPNHNNGGYDSRSRPSMQISRPKQGVLQKSNRKFADAYEYERDPSHHSGSSGAARKVMDFFRRRGKARAGE